MSLKWNNNLSFKLLLILELNKVLISLYTLSFCTKIRLHVYHLSWPLYVDYKLRIVAVRLRVWKKSYPIMQALKTRYGVDGKRIVEDGAWDRRLRANGHQTDGKRIVDGQIFRKDN